MTGPRLDDKTFSTLQANAALQGAQLIRSADEQGREVFIISKWAMCRQLDSFDEVEQLLQRMAGS